MPENLDNLSKKRGYVKGSLTRLFDAIEGGDISSQSTEMLQIKKQRCISTFESYEKLNEMIICLDSADNEDVASYESKYFVMLSTLQSELNRRVTQEITPAQRQIKLPVIEIPTFTGRYSDYTSFRELFKSVIESDASLDRVQKLHYLKSFLKGEPLELVKNLPLIEASFAEATRLLDDRYYNKYKIINELISSLLDLPIINKPSPSNVRQFISSVRQTLAALSNLGAKVQDWDPILMCIFIRKIDIHMAQSYQLERDSKAEPKVDNFIGYLEKRALAMENAEPARDKPATAPKSVNAVTKEKQGCHYCKSNDHKVYTCKTFKILPSADRISFAKNKGLCNICLNIHPGKCRFHFRCNECKKSHHSLLHHNEVKPEPVVMLSGDNTNSVLIPTARIKLYAKDGREVHIKAILDSASQASLITSKAIKVLGLTPMRENTSIIGVTNNKSQIQYSVPLEIHSLKSPFKTEINCHVVNTITCNLPQTMVDQSSIKIPPGIQLADEEYYKPSEINMLIGADVFFQVLQPTLTPKAATQPPLAEQQRQPARQEPPPEGQQPPRAGLKGEQGTVNIVNTKFGHIVAGGLPSQNEVNKIVSLVCTKCDVDSSIAKFWETEKVPEIFKEHIPEQELVEDNFQSNFQLSNNRFQVDLPLKVPIGEVNDTLGESFDLALYRFLNLEKKLQKNIHLQTEYHKFIHQYVELGHAHFVNFESINFNKDPVYFLPHHAVINEGSKTTRTRVVFDGSMKTRNKISLNDILLNGPIVQRDLFDIILLYRIGDYTFNSDIIKMFRNVLVNPDHTSLQNILWRDRPDEPIKCIRLDTVTYGLKSSSYLATRCLLELANQHEQDFPLASFIIKNCIYVDDVLYANSDLNTLFEAKAQLESLLGLGGFKMHKWASNCETFLNSTPINDRQLDNIEFQKEVCSIKALGLTIDANNDCFIIKCPDNFTCNSATKRQILSQIAKCFDPQGYVTPLTVKAKVIMQKLWCEKIDWDASPPQHIKNEWAEFANGLMAMEPIYIPRNIQVPENAQSVQLVGFADASSSTGYGACLYLRVVDRSGKVTLSLLCSKSRINPQTKPLTIPRLELNAMLLLAKLTHKVYDTIKIKISIDEVLLFSDSQIALAWINTETIKLQAYVANRVRVVQQLTAGWRWGYVDTHQNPADYISRGLDPHELPACKMWWRGPEFLQHREYKFSPNYIMKKIGNLPELKTGATTATTDEPATSAVVLLTLKQKEFSQILEKYSDVNKMTRILAYVLRFCHNSRKNNDKIKSQYLSGQELQQALSLVIKHEQEHYFSEEINSLIKDKNVKGSLQPLHPFIDEQGLLRVGGRLQNSALSYNQKHPIILPKGSKLTERLILNEHLKLFHAGPKLLLAQLNQKYWLVNGLRQVKKITHKCLPCFRLKANCAKQLMGSLPKQRVVASRAFETVAIDFAGPIEIKNSRIRKALISKGYICVFVCFNTKAIHLELASDLTTETFLACFKRFISRRAMPSEVFCDNGGSFRGAANHLAELYKLHRSTEHQTLVHNFTAPQNIKFNFTPSYSPVFASLAEAAVKSMKYHLKRQLQKSILTYEQLNTVLIQIEAILNSRPLIALSCDISDFTYLTPGHFLVGVPLVSYPEPDISEIPTNRLKFWQLVESIKQGFWKVWHKQYLNTLQCRQKWRDDVPNICVGDLVLLKEPNSPPLYWPMARISKVFPGNDNKVRAFEVTAPNRKVYRRSLSGICLLPISN